MSGLRNLWLTSTNREKPLKNPGEMNHTTCFDHIKPYVQCSMNYCLFACKFNTCIIRMAVRTNVRTHWGRTVGHTHETPLFCCFRAEA